MQTFLDPSPLFLTKNMAFFQTLGVLRYNYSLYQTASRLRQACYSVMVNET